MFSCPFSSNIWKEVVAWIGVSLDGVGSVRYLRGIMAEEVGVVTRESDMYCSYGYVLVNMACPQ